VRSREHGRVDVFPMPRNLVAAATRQHREAWLATLPGTVKELEDRWSLDVGEPFQPGGETAWVAPVHTGADEDLVLKVAWWHSEGAHEAAGLRVWNGQGAVRLHRTEVLGDTVALLIERCVPGTALAGRPESEQDDVIAALLPRLWQVEVCADEFRPLQEMCDAWANEFEVKLASQPGTLDAGLVRAGVALFRALPASADRDVLLCTDLHAQNVIAAAREPWLMIDPKPYVGDPTYDPLQHLLNCDERLRNDPFDLARRMADRLGLDYDRLLLWLFARCVVESIDWPELAPIARLLAPRT
jgi:streptomycin 6-kinase